MKGAKNDMEFLCEDMIKEIMNRGFEYGTNRAIELAKLEALLRIAECLQSIVDNSINCIAENTNI